MATVQIEFLKPYSIYNTGMIKVMPADVANGLIKIGAAKEFVQPQSFFQEHITSKLVKKVPKSS